MKLHKLLIRASSPFIFAAATAALVVGVALPASAATTGATFAITGGSLTLAVQPTASLTGVATGATAISGSLGLVTVTDNRGGTAAWTVTAGSSTFTGALAGAASTSTNVQYNAGTIDTSTSTGSITVTNGTETAITATASVVAPSALSGNNIATWTPALAVTMPASAIADTYSGTVTTSIS
jgi:hypothetical protein